MAQFGANVLVTGANRGLGLGFVRLLTKENGVQKIFAGCRDPSKANDLQNIEKSNPEKVKILQLDVQKDSSIKSAYDQVKSILKSEGLNVLINNAGILETDGASYENVKRENFLNTFDVNTMGAVVMNNVFYPLLRQSADAKKRTIVVNISSLLGSASLNRRFTLHHTGRDATCDVYGMSKSALNHYTRIFGSEEIKNGIITVAFCPGWVQTDMGGQGADLTIDESISTLIETTKKLKPEDSGRFMQHTGESIAY